MKDFLSQFAALLLAICLSPFVCAQASTGDSTLDIDELSGVGTATCETAVDAVAENYYSAEVDCTVTDSNGTTIAYGEKTDDDYGNGFAQIVLSFPCTPGTIYTVNANHFLNIKFDKLILESGRPSDLEPFDLFDSGSMRLR